MILFGCEWCKAIKEDDETWILGLAAESIGITAARREITILPVWEQSRACHPLAVHFCSVEHKDNYMAALFETESMPAETVIRTKAKMTPGGTEERQYLRTASSGAISKTTKKRATTKARRSA
ncbi:MAG: hypothetical protein ACXVZR_04540 [Terriglobales bacterium]